MNAHHDFPTDEDLILYHYGESPDAEAITAELARSAAAQTRYAELRALLATADEWTPELPADFEGSVWQRLQPRLARERVAPLATPIMAPPPTAPDTAPATLEPTTAAAGRVLPAAHRFGARVRRILPAAAAATLLLAVGYLAGRLATNQPPQPQALSAEARQRLLAETLAEHLERSQRLFTELANAAPEAGAELAAEQRTAEELLSANRLYRTAAERGGREGVAALLAEMEPVLLELAHLPEEPQAADLEFLRRRIDARGLLFKTRVASELLTRSLEPDSPPLTRSTV